MLEYLSVSGGWRNDPRPPPPEREEDRRSWHATFGDRWVVSRVLLCVDCISEVWGNSSAIVDGWRNTIKYKVVVAA